MIVTYVDRPAGVLPSWIDTWTPCVRCSAAVTIYYLGVGVYEPTWAVRIHHVDGCPIPAEEANSGR